MDWSLIVISYEGIDIERTVKDSIKLFNHTPPSIADRRCDNPMNRLKAPEEEKYLNLPVSLIFSFRAFFTILTVVTYPLKTVGDPMLYLATV